jgi:hypothetical protein
MNLIQFNFYYMKKIFLMYGLLMLCRSINAQVLLEDKDGDVLFRNIISPANDLALIKLNTGNQSLGFRYIVSSALKNTSNYKIQEFSVQAKPTEGYAAVFKNGQFSPGVQLAYSLTKVPLFCNKVGYTDWGSVNIGYDISKYTLFDEEAAFDKQFHSKDYKGLSISLNYNALIKSIWIASVKAGYTRSNNYDELTAIEAKDVIIINDAVSGIQRQISKNRTGRKGNYTEFDAYPLCISVTKATATDPLGSAAAGKLKIGYTIYLKTLMSEELPDTNAGLLFFLTKQASNGVRNPVFGINVQAADPFNATDQEKGLVNRMSVAFTTVFSL